MGHRTASEQREGGTPNARTESPNCRFRDVPARPPGAYSAQSKRFKQGADFLALPVAPATQEDSSARAGLLAAGDDNEHKRPGVPTIPSPSPAASAGTSGLRPRTHVKASLRQVCPWKGLPAARLRRRQRRLRGAEAATAPRSVPRSRRTPEPVPAPLPGAHSWLANPLQTPEKLDEKAAWTPKHRHRGRLNPSLLLRDSLLASLRKMEEPLSKAKVPKRTTAACGTGHPFQHLRRHHAQMLNNGI